MKNKLEKIYDEYTQILLKIKNYYNELCYLEINGEKDSSTYNECLKKIDIEENKVDGIYKRIISLNNDETFELYNMIAVQRPSNADLLSITAYCNYMYIFNNLPDSFLIYMRLLKSVADLSFYKTVNEEKKGNYENALYFDALSKQRYIELTDIDIETVEEDYYKEFFIREKYNFAFLNRKVNYGNYKAKENQYQAIEMIHVLKDFINITDEELNDIEKARSFTLAINYIQANLSYINKRDLNILKESVYSHISKFKEEELTQSLKALRDIFDNFQVEDETCEMTLRRKY